MVSAKTEIVNDQGMHMRPAQVLVTTAAKFPCDITIRFEEKKINAKSILNVMAACIKKGSQIEVSCEGEQEEQALKAILELIRSGLGE